MVNACRWIGHLVPGYANAVDAGVRFERTKVGAAPINDGGPLPHGGRCWREAKGGCPGYGELAVRDVIIHVALVGVRLTPGILMRRHVLAFSEISRSLIIGRKQIAREDTHPVRCPQMSMTTVIGGIWIRSGVKSGKRIHPCTRAEAALAVIQTRPIRIGAAGAQMRAADTVATVAANILRERGEGVFQPGLADLLEPLVVSGAAALAIQILWNDRVIIARQLEPIKIDGAGIARSGS